MTTIESNITTYGTRDLIYGGLTRDRLGHACMVGWEYPITSTGNIALFKIKVEPAPTLTIRQVAGWLDSIGITARCRRQTMSPALGWM